MEYIVWFVLFSCISTRLWVINVTNLLPMKNNIYILNWSWSKIFHSVWLFNMNYSFNLKCLSNIHPCISFLLLIKMKQYIYIFLQIKITFIMSIKTNKILFVVCAHITNPKCCKILTFKKYLILNTFFSLLVIEKKYVDY